MKTFSHASLWIAGLLLSCSTSLVAQIFTSGSNGSYGAINVTGGQSVTLPMPANGIFHCTTITIANGSVLRFTKNAANTPVYLLASGAITIGQGAEIHVMGSNASGSFGGLGGPGGFDGGQGGPNPSDGHGPGGGKWGWATGNSAAGVKPANMNYRGSAGHATKSTVPAQAASDGDIYGNALLLPLVGGSGGGGGAASNLTYAYGGGGGGGAILLASDLEIILSTSGTNPSALDATGGYGLDIAGNGSGGSIRLVAPKVSGNLTVRTPPYNSSGDWGGFGRCRIDTLDRSNFALRISSGSSPRSSDFVTYGSNMTVFPPNMPSLRITQVGTQAVPVEQVTPVFVLFPTGSAATQTVSVSVTNFHSQVPLRAVVTPESGSKQTFDFTVDNTAGGTTTGSVQVQIPAGVSSRVDVWTR